MKFIILCIFFLGSLSAAETDEVLYVSLGGHCEVASQLRHHNLRKDAYPFDWLITSSHDKFLEILDNDFQDFTNEDCIFRNPKYPLIPDNHCYECEFRHDQVSIDNENLSAHIEEISVKYDRRITRFRCIREFKGKVFFIRSPFDIQNGGPYLWWRDEQERITAVQAKELKTALARFFPGVDFTLVIVNYAEENVENFGDIAGLLEFKVSRARREYDYARLFDLLRQQIR